MSTALSLSYTHALIEVVGSLPAYYMLEAICARVGLGLGLRLCFHTQYQTTAGVYIEHVDSVLIHKIKRALLTLFPGHVEYLGTRSNVHY